MAVFQTYRGTEYSIIGRVIHPQTTLVWDAFNTTAERAFKMGWEFSLITDNYRRCLNITGINKKDPESYRFISGPIREDKIALDNLRRYSEYPLYKESKLMISMQIAGKIFVQGTMTPITENLEIGRLIEDHGKTQTWELLKDEDDSKKIITDPETVSELLEKITKLQQPVVDEMYQQKVKLRAGLYTI